MTWAKIYGMFCYKLSLEVSQDLQFIITQSTVSDYLMFNLPYRHLPLALM